jgi:polyferredoxin
MRVQHWRRLTQATFYLLFIAAPIFNLFRVDLTADHAWLLGMEWRLGLDAFQGRGARGAEAGLNIFLRLIIPVFSLAGLLMWVSWKWGRLFCGWLCPHFPIVELINHFFIRASGKPTFWTRARLSEPNRKVFWGLISLLTSVALAFSWAVVLLTNFLPPAEIYGNLWRAELTRNQFTFIAIITTVLSLDFIFARHLFCRTMCSVGLFQSLAWMQNKSALVVGFDRPRGASCGTCLPDQGSACNNACPMLLKPRSIKRHMFTCTQCGLCLDACAETQQNNPQGPLLSWVSGEAARQNEAGFSAHLK